MEALITNIETARQYVRLPFLNSTTYLADFEGAQRRYLLPILGNTLLASLSVAGVNVNLKKLVLRAVAPLAYYIDLPAINVSITDNGVTQKATDNATPAPRWAFLQVREMLAEKGCMALEELLTFLVEEKPTDVTWQPPADYNLIFKTGKEFNRYFSIYQPYRTFEGLRPIVAEVEDSYIITAIGEAFFIALRDSTTPTEDEKKAITLIKKAVANLTIYKACAKLPVRKSADGFTTTLAFNSDQPNVGQNNAELAQLGILSTAAQQEGEGYVNQLAALLQANASSTIYPLFFTGNLYVTPIAATTAAASFNKDLTVFSL